MKIVLVKPPFVNIKTGPPIGLAYLSNVLKEQGHDVKIIDINTRISHKYKKFGRYTRDFVVPDTHPAKEYAYSHLDDYCGEVLSWSPDIVGFSLSYPTAEYGIEMARKISPHVRCIVGGPQATYNESKLLNLGYFDTVVSGYGEEAVLEAIHKKGIISKDLEKSKEYRPDYSELPLELYNGRLPLLTSRGCPNRCFYCTHRLQYIVHSAASVVDQINSVPNIRDVMYNDSNINASTSRTVKLFTELAKIKDPPPGVIAGVEVNTGFKEYIPKMAEAGIREVRIGIESGSARERGSMNRPPTDNDLTAAFVKELTDHNILTHAQFIFCYPDQSENDRRETTDLMKRLNDTCDTRYIKHIWYRFVVHHGTEDFFNKKYGVTASSPQNWENHLYTPQKVEQLYREYSQKIPDNARILI